MRKLASIQIISDIKPIENADFIEVGVVNGWEVVIKKNAFKIGDKCVYFEIDSVLPVENFPFLEETKGRVRTIKLRKQISQGLCLPISEVLGDDVYNVGDDVTEILGVIKYEVPEAFKMGDSAGVFPNHLIQKTDEERIQSNLEYIGIFLNKPWVSTVKYDGTSSTFGWDDDVFVQCGRNHKKKDGDNVFYDMVEKYDLKKIPKKYMIQGEICGPRIQKNCLNIKNNDLFIFIVFNKETKEYLTYDERIEFCKNYGLKHVELNDRGEDFQFNLKELLERSEGNYLSGKTREGLVYEIDHSPKRVSFKVINNKFLLKGGV